MESYAGNSFIKFLKKKLLNINIAGNVDICAYVHIYEKNHCHGETFFKVLSLTLFRIDVEKGSLASKIC